MSYKIPSGCVVVPIEPTPEMIRAGLAATSMHHDIPGSGLMVAREKMRLRYLAMVSSVQQPTEFVFDSSRIKWNSPEDKAAFEASGDD